MTTLAGRLRRQTAGVVALLVAIGLFVISRPPEPSAAAVADAASRYGFRELPIALVEGLPRQTIREVNQDYKNIDAWISSVGAGIALNDLDGDGLPNDLCVTDPRVDEVQVTPAPGAGAHRYPPFVLDPAPLPMNRAVAPMGCAPGDFNADGRMDALVYYWGRTPVMFLRDPDVQAFGAAGYVPVEVVPNTGGATYKGPQWNTNAVVIDDFDGDGNVDVYIGNYFAEGPVLDSTVAGGVSMNYSLSNATNGGEDYILRLTAATGAPRPSVSYELVTGAFPESVSRGWVLAAAANDLDGDLLPELYVAQDHGLDALLHNRSTPGHIRFVPVFGRQSPVVPKSKRIGADSFKGMGADWADLNGDGLYDLFVSNITTSFGIEESNFHFVNTARTRTELRANLRDNVAPFEDRSTDFGTAWGGWCWDVKTADFNNSGDVAIAQTDGFVKGETNRWPQLQELATANDLLVADPAWWPHVRAGDDIAGRERMHLFVKNGDRYVDVAPALGLDVPVPTRGVAIADTDGDGRLELAVARQWEAPAFYHNEAPAPGDFLGLRLFAEGTRSPGVAPAPGSPAVGAQVVVTTSDGRRVIGRVDGGSGHSGKRSTDVHIGLGRVVGPVQVSLAWRDRAGQPHEQQLQLTPGWHTLTLGSQVKED
ncbi:CRTAC1 family protein [Actinomycetes bacterium KLBMP 9797]